MMNHCLAILFSIIGCKIPGCYVLIIAAETEETRKSYPKTFFAAHSMPLIRYVKKISARNR